MSGAGLFEVVLTATALLCAVMLLRLVLKKRISAGLRYALWLLVLIRLLIPVNLFPSRASVMNALPEPEVLQANLTAALPAVPEPAEASAPVQTQTAKTVFAEPAYQPEAPAPQPAPKPLPWRAIIWGVWLAGAIAVGAWFLAVNLRFSLRLRRTRRRLALDYPIPVYQADFLPSPCLAGVFRPAIYLNANAAALEDQAALQHILTHELCHKKHGDQLWSILRGLCLALWWFHPLVWAAAILSKQDCELSCDEAAVKALGEAQRISYGMTLVSMVNQKRPGPRELLCASTSMTEGKKEIKERVIFVTNRQKMTKRALTLALALALLAGICTFTGAVTTDKPSALPYQVQPDPQLKRAELDQNAPVIPDFPWSGLENDYRLEVATRWMAEYGKQFYALPEGHPWKASDVKVVDDVFHDTGSIISTRLLTPSDPKGSSTVGGWYCLAVKPAGGLEAVSPLFQGGVPRGTGALSDYALLEYHLSLERVQDSAGAWLWKTRAYTAPCWNKNPPPAYEDWTDELLAQWKPSIGMTPIQQGTGRAAWQALGEEWAEEFTHMFRSFIDSGTPLKSDDTQVLSVDLEAWDPDDDPQTLFFHVKFAFRPIWETEKARRCLERCFGGGDGIVDGTGEWADYLIVDAALTLVKEEVFEDSAVRWMGYALTLEPAAGYAARKSLPAAVAELPAASASLALPRRVAPRSGWSIKALDTSLAYVPDDGKGDLRTRWAESFGQQFYTLPASDPWKASDVQIRDVGSRICLAVKPAGGTAALEPLFPQGCPKGHGELEGYLLLQFTAAFRRESVPALSQAPVWRAAYLCPIRAVQPPEVDSVQWKFQKNFEGFSQLGYYWTVNLDADPARYQEVGERFAQGYLERHLAFDSNCMALADDAKVLKLELTDTGTEAGRPVLEFQFQYAFRPLWGTEVLDAFFDGDLTLGAGPLSGYVIRSFSSVKLAYQPPEGAGAGRWVCTELREA